MVKPSDIGKLTGVNYWKWKSGARALLMADGLWNAVDPSVAVPNGVIQMRTWTNENQKAYGILYLTLEDTVQAKVDNAGVGTSGRLLWAQLESFYTTSNPATRSMLMSQFNGLSHDISQPVDTFLQAVVTAESRLTAIAVSLPSHMVHDKILGGLSSVYSPITAVLQNESPQRSVPDLVTAVNAWEHADLQKRDSVIKAARARLNHGGEDFDPDAPTILAARSHSHRSHQPSTPSSHSSHSASGKEFDWTNTKNRTDVCNRCGLTGHFAQYCVSIMPEDVRRRIIRNRAQQANLADDTDSDSERDSANVAATAFHANSHIAAAVLDLPSEIHIDTMDPTMRESVFGAFMTPYPHGSVEDHLPTPPSPALTASTSSIAGTPNKKNKKKKKKKKSNATVEDVQVALHKLSLKEEEDEFSV